MRRGPSGKQTGYHYLTDNSIVQAQLGENSDSVSQPVRLFSVYIDSTSPFCRGECVKSSVDVVL
jgi:hypothetical protein